MKWLIAITVLTASCWASTINAASCNTTDVQTAINTAVNGDTVAIPAGTCSWSTSATVPSTKGLIIQCANTVFVDANPESLFLVNLKSGNALDRITGCTFNGNNFTKNGTAGEIEVNSSTDAQNSFRLDHNHLYDMGHRGFPLGMNGHDVSGLVDHNTFDKASGTPVQAISVFGDCAGCSTQFNYPLQLGSSHYIYIEDNTFNYTGSFADGAMDAYFGARWVFRHNVVNGTYFGWHGADSGNGRGVHSFEIYANSFTNTNAAIFITLFSRSGTGVVWNNTITGGYNSDHTLEMRNYRSCASFAPWGQCDGTSIWDQNSSGQQGWACLDQTGHTFTAASGGSNTLNPQYTWKNIKNGVEADAKPDPSACSTMQTFHLLENRDFYNYSASFTGTSGVGQGLLAARPATCTPLVAYYATDNTTLYQCATTNTWTAIYSPYTYPHPLQGSTGPIASFSPSSLAFGSQVSGTTSLPQTVTLTNNGGTTLNITTIALQTGTQYAISTNSCGSTLAPSANCAVSVTFHPTSTGAKTDNLRFTTNAPSSVDSIPLTGTGVNVATALYVNNSGTPACADSPSNGSLASPYCTIVYGMSQMASGATLYVQGGPSHIGSYSESVDFCSTPISCTSVTGPAGSAGNPTTISAYPGDLVTILGASTAHGRVKLEFTSYVTFNGFIVTNWNQGIFVEESDHVIISNNTVHDVGVEAIHPHLDSSFITVSGNTVYNTGLLGTDGECVYVGSGDSLPVDNTNNVTVIGNLLHDCSSEGVELKIGTHDNTVDGNTIYRANTVNNGFGGAAIEVNQAVGSAQHWGSNPNQLIRNNILHDNGPNTGSTLVNSGIRLGTGSTAYNNVVYNVNALGDGIFTDNGSGDSYTRKIYENTVDVVSARAIVNLGGTTDIKNNIGPPGDFQGNLATNINFFTNQPGANYTLVAGAAPVSSGLTSTLSTVPVDILGNSRSNNPQPSIGAYEFTGTVETPPTAPAPGMITKSIQVDGILMGYR